MESNYRLAYLAGLADGEAYIGIKKSKPYKNLTGRVNPSYHERIQIRMVDEEAIKFLATELGGWYYKEKSHSGKGKPLYCYQASDKKASEIIKKLLPFLLVKKQVADTVLKLRAEKDNPEKVKTAAVSRSRWGTPMTGQRTTLSPAAVARREALYIKCKEINAVGI
jgi:hypothetical protein